MLHKVVVENFFSIAERQEIDFTVPRNAPDLDCFVSSIADPDIRLPVIVGFYGANASGKTSVLRAVANCITFVLKSLDNMPLDGNGIGYLFQSYRKQALINSPTKLILEFDAQPQGVIPASLFRYELHIEHDNLIDKKVAYEALSSRTSKRWHKLFERNQQKISLFNEFKTADYINKKIQVSDQASAISIFAKFNHDFSKHVFNVMSYFKSNIFGLQKGDFDPSRVTKFYLLNKLCLDKLNIEIKKCDIGIESIKIIPAPQGPIFIFEHQNLDGNLTWQEESEGTKSFIAFFPILYYVLEKGGVALLDELDAELHPLLMLEILNWFNDPERNPHGAQLLFTAHNTVIMDDLEKEQVFFTEKTSDHGTSVYSARDITALRREPSLSKKYLSGALGAVPRSH
jgi:AAA15 family ATPase/GTPase